MVVTRLARFTRRSAAGWIWVVLVDELFAELGSVVVVLTVAVLVAVLGRLSPTGLAVVVTVTVTAPPLTMVPRLQLTFGEAPRAGALRA